MTRAAQKQFLLRQFLKIAMEIAASSSAAWIAPCNSASGLSGQRVATFLQNLGGQYNGLYKAAASGRSIPDNPAQVFDFVFVHRTANQTLAPNLQIAVDIISLLDDYRLSKGQPALDFLNPGCMATGSQAPTTSHLVRTRAATLMYSLLALNGILCVPEDLCLFTF
ncbi:hypothetical protein BJY52DRAFT_1191687 [Lactarius psammicola]|nr:hypothetical protein BJY52DRAFT_1191687 [Lactarius psammicola]